jgi:hypothetical protein
VDSLIELGALYADRRANAVFLLLGKENTPVGHGEYKKYCVRIPEVLIDLSKLWRGGRDHEAGELLTSFVI